MAPARSPADLRRRIRADLRSKRRLPRAIILTLIAAGIATVLWAGTLVVAYLEGRGSPALRLAVLMLTTGREPALLAAYEHDPPMPLGNAVIQAPVQDVATVLLSLGLLALAFRRLRSVRWTYKLLAGVERQALEKRHWVRRFGVFGVVLFYFLPGFGSGALTACALGLLAGLELGALAVALSVGGVVVSVAWAVALHFASGLLPNGPWSKWLPLVFLGLIGAAAARNAWKRRGHPPEIWLDRAAHPTGAHAELVAKCGLDVRRGAVVADLRRLAAATGIPAKHGPHLRAAAELLLVDGITPAAARKLAQLGIGGIDDLALLDPTLAAEATGSSAADAAAWHVAAQGMVRRHAN